MTYIICLEMFNAGVMVRLITFLIFVVLIGLLPACQSGENTPEATPVVAVKQLVTVEVPPTLSIEQRYATQQAQPRTPTPQPPTPSPSPTAYIGVFIGEAQSVDELPAIDELIGEPVAIEDVVDSNCEIPIDPGFGENWRRDPTIPRQLACPLQERFGFAGQVQVFERGVMYSRNGTSEVWAISPGRIDAGNYWFVSDPLPFSTEGMQAPEGLNVPTDLLGSVWLSQPEIGNTLGYAITPEQVADLNIQRFEGGTVFLDVTVGQIFVLLVNGDAYGPFSQ